MLSLLIELILLELNQLFFRTMHSSALRALECIALGGAVQQVTTRQVMSKLVMPKLVTERE